MSSQTDKLQARKANSDDFLKIEHLITENTYRLFGPKSIDRILNQCFCTILIENTQGNIVAMVGCNDHPNIASIPSWDWYDWLYNLYGIDYMNTRNSVFIHLALWDQSYTQIFLKYVLEYIFADNQYLEYVLMIVPPGTKNVNFLSLSATRINPIGHGDSYQVQSLRLMIRQHYVKSYKIRRAVEEDNDDLVSLIDRQSSKLTCDYGEYYIAELITRHRNGRQLIVAEYNGFSVAVLCLNHEIDYELINRNFQLIKYHGLRKKHPDDDLSEMEQNSSLSRVESLNESKCESIKSINSASSLSLEESVDEFSLADISSIHLFEPIDTRDQSINDNDTDNDTEYRQEDFLEENDRSEKIPTFFGEANAFILEIVAAQEEHESEALFLLLQAAFECYPDRDYCLLGLPSMIDTRFDFFDRFVWITPRNRANYPHELYLCHRNSILGSVSIRPYREIDDKPIVDRSVIDTVNDNEINQKFVIENENQYVGLVIIKEIDDDCTNIDDKGLIDYFLLSPIFHRHADYLLREIHRLTTFGRLYHRLDPDRLEKCSVISELSPVKESLFLSTPRLTYSDRYEINTKIVVVGLSDISLSFMQNLILNRNRHVIYHNITLISPEDIAKNDNEQIRKLFLPNAEEKSIFLQTYINRIDGFMTGIDRKNRYVIVNDSMKIGYDLLVLLCGMQFHLPATIDEKKKPLKNVFTINNDRDADRAIEYLRKSIGSTNNPVLVYGHCLEAYCCLSALLSMGIDGNKIIIVIPTIESIFNDEEIEETINQSIKSQGITIYYSYELNDWIVNDKESMLIGVKFESRYHMKYFNCTCLFIYDKKTVNSITFDAINGAGLIFDGNLVIDKRYRTNDENIFAAGTLSKYPRKYYADNMAHRYFNLKEIGQDLSREIFELLLPNLQRTEQEEISYQHDNENFVKKFEKPLWDFCILPGGIRYFSVRKPGRIVPLEIAMNSDRYGQLFITGDLKNLKAQGYFKLHLNDLGTVETIVCLSVNDIDWKNLLKLWRKHETLLNNLRTRFETIQITDLFDYFRGSWTEAIYHERFDRFEDDLRSILIDGSIIDVIHKKYREKNYQALNALEWDEIENEFSDIYPEIIRGKFLQFLEKETNLLRYYAHPSTIRSQMENHEKSPLFREQ